VTETAAVTWLTQEAFDRLKAELDQLSGPGRADITAKIASAREEGDLKENGGYHAAREEQAKQEARIRELTAKLRNVEIGSPPPPRGGRAGEGRQGERPGATSRSAPRPTAASSGRAWSSRRSSRATR